MSAVPASAGSREKLADRVALPSLWPQVLESAGICLWLVALEEAGPRTLFLTSAASGLLGRPRESLLLDPGYAWEAVHPEDRGRVRQAWEQLLQGRPASGEVRLLTPRQEIRWVRVEAIPLVGETPGSRLAAVWAIDLTFLRQALNQGREAEARLRAVFSLPSLGVALLSATAEIREANSTFLEMLDPGGVLLETCRHLFEALCHSSEDFQQVEKRYLRADHQMVFVRVSLSLVRDEAGAPVGGLALVENLTGQRRTEEALCQSRERFRLLYDRAPLAYQTLDADGRLLDVNQTWLELTGYSRDEVLDRWFGAFLTAESAPLFEQVFFALKHGSEITEVELTLACRDGRHLPVALTGKGLTDAGGRFQQALLLAADISWRKEAEEALRRSELRYRTLVEQIPAITYTARADDFTAKLFFSPQAQTILGFSWSDYEQDPDLWRRRLHPEDREWVLADMARCQAEGTPFAAEYRMLTADNRVVWLRDEARLITDVDGRPLVLQGVILDITARRRSEEALRRSEENYRLLVGSIPGVVFRGYADWRIEVFDDQVEKLTGYPREDFTSGRLKWCDLILPEDLPEARRPFVEALKGDRSYVRSYRIRHREGHPVWVQARGQIILDADGRIDHVIGVCFDISAQKKVEEQLATEKERLAVTLRSIGDGVIATDTRGRIVLMNDVAERLTGWTQAGAQGLPATRVFCLSEEQNGDVVDPVLEVIRTGRPLRLPNHVLLVPREGPARSISATAAPIVDRGGQVDGVVLVFQDITVRKQLEAEFRKIEKLSSLSILAGGIAHDFNNILTGILGNLSLAMIAHEDQELLLPRLAEAERAALRARDLVQQLLTFAKGGAPVKEVASLPEIIRESANFTTRGSPARVVFDLAPDLKPAEVDPAQFSQVIQNLILNAVQAMPQGGTIWVTAENIHLGADSGLPLPEGPYIRIAIKDQGVGIPQNYLAKIFDPYFSTKPKGSGLGLATAYSIIKNHGGYMTVASQVGHGTAFHLYLPASVQQAPPPRPRSLAEPIPGQGRVLVMDDDEMVRSVAGKILTHLGYEADFAADGEEALTLYATAHNAGRPFDVVIMDLTIPGGLGGKEAIRRLLDMDPEARAIVSSGYADDPILTNYQEYGFKGVIRKPYRILTFSQELARVLSLS